MTRRLLFMAILLFILPAAACSAAPAAAPTAAVQSAASPTSAGPIAAPTQVVLPTTRPAPDAHFPPAVIDYVNALVDGHKIPGIAIALLTPEGTFFYNYGAFTWESDQEIDEHTLFEIGSITKVFTATLLANAVEEGLLTLDTPAQELAPEGVTMPLKVDQDITLRDIASHRSGLPRMPSNFMPERNLNPYADYTAEKMYAYLDGLKLGRAPGEQYEYSNLGFMLLGDLLERAYGRSYEELVSEVIAGPLDMPDTVLTLTEGQQARFALAHSGPYPVEAWDFLLPGVGALKSTTSDLIRFMQANMYPADDQPGRAMQLIRAECYETGNTSVEVCLGIHTWHVYGKMIYQHDGQTGGYHSFAGFAPEDGTAVVVLANSNESISAIGLHLLDARALLE
jgi:D-alanyl-D-alanine-carboxypeptidase/D-alanyl-D-alanine-endopeptidase